MAIAKPRKRKLDYIDELKELIVTRFPDAKFRVTRMPDTRKGIAIWTYTSADDQEVAALVSERQVDIMIEEGLFLYVIPMPLEALED